MSSKEPFRVAVIGCSWLAAEVLRRLSGQGIELALVTEPEDKLAKAAAEELGVPHCVKPRRLPLLSANFPWRPDLIVSAHSFCIVPAWFLQWSRLGAIGYHPSILPDYKGRHAIRDCLANGGRFTGGTVHWMTPVIDAGPAVVAYGKRLQERVQILPGETALGLWKRALAPIGANLLEAAVKSVSFTTL
ncbi:formyltransferase family protein [Cribrihabitans pelagius]|uniref:formyltransferase family protein n=1 Tax=Cribrihabitans pelagius TaxID=1765746 RepID=UPI003B5C96EC